MRDAWGDRRRTIGIATIVVVLAIGAIVLLRGDAHRASLPVQQGIPFPKEETPRIDTHTHLMVGALPLLRDVMSRYGIVHVVDLSGGSPDTNLHAHLAQAAASEGRITVFMTFPGHELSAPGYGERIASMLVRAHDLGARGLKIHKALGLGYRDAYGRLVPVDDSGLDPVFEMAGRLGIPVAIHAADPKAFWDPPGPSNERNAELRVHPRWSFFGRAVPSWSDLLDQLERRIARHPSTTFIAVHFGCAAEEPDRVDRMLRSYPNLYIDTAARFPEFGRHAAQRMRQFFLTHQDRVLFGTDLGVGLVPEDIVPGSAGDEPPTMQQVDQFFMSSYRYLGTDAPNIPSPTPIQGDWDIHGIALPRNVLRKVLFRNAQRLLRLP
jgi:predicted TIM-barrel fold metal-dependent hydrolase